MVKFGKLCWFGLFCVWLIGHAQHCPAAHWWAPGGDSEAEHQQWRCWGHSHSRCHSPHSHSQHVRQFHSMSMVTFAKPMKSHECNSQVHHHHHHHHHQHDDDDDDDDDDVDDDAPGAVGPDLPGLRQRHRLPRQPSEWHRAHLWHRSPEGWPRAMAEGKTWGIWTQKIRGGLNGGRVEHQTWRFHNHADWTISIRDYTIVWLTIAKITTWLNMIWNHMPQETY